MDRRREIEMANSTKSRDLKKGTAIVVYGVRTTVVKVEQMGGAIWVGCLSDDAMNPEGIYKFSPDQSIALAA